MFYKVFISSAFKDRDLARDLARRLEEAGAKVFSIEEAAVSESIEATIKRGLEEADEVIVLLTDHSVNNLNVMFELGAAFSLHKRVTPVVVGVEAHEIPSMLKHLRYIKYADLKDYISELAKRAKETAALLNKSPRGGISMARCTRCYGKGYVRCKRCHGTGTVGKGLTCNVCGGEGKLTCNACGGSGRF